MMNELLPLRVQLMVVQRVILASSFSALTSLCSSTPTHKKH